MAKTETILSEPVKIEKFIPGGQALGTLSSGKKIMLWGALPEETVVKAKITKDKKSYAEGIALEIENSSAQRVEPKDQCYLATSPWQILDYNYELICKKELLQEILQQHKINTDVEIEDVKTDGKDYGYRNKMEYALYYDNGEEKTFLAFRERGTHRKVAIEKSSLERQEILDHAQEIVLEMNDRSDEARKYQMLLMRADQNGKVSGGLVPNYKKRPVFPNLSDEILGYKYSYSPNGFFQINIPVYEMALKEIAKEISSEKVLDLYAGVGTIGLSVARDRILTLVECNGAAYQEMEKNCQNCGENVQPILAKSEEALEYLEPKQTVILDPPRAGLDIKLTEKLLEILPEKIIYLSCNPATQARDVKMLQEKYRITKIAPFNFFPRTPHLENLIVLEVKHGSTA